MENQEKKEKTLYLPTNLNTKQDFIQGFGVGELPKAIVILGTGCIIAFIYKLIKNDMGITMGIIIVFLFLAIILCTRDQNNLSVTDYLLSYLRFNKEIQKFNYKPIKKWDI